MNIPERLYYKKNKMLATWKSKMAVIFQGGRQFNNVLTWGNRSNCDTNTKFGMNIPGRLYYKKKNVGHLKIQDGHHF